MESKGVKMHIDKTTLCTSKGVQTTGRWPCGVWLRLLSIDAFGPEHGLHLMQEGDITVVLGAVGSSGSGAGIREKTT